MLNVNYQQGNTIRVTATFKDFDGFTSIKPDSVKFTIYNGRYIQLEQHDIDPNSATTIGEYTYDFTPAQPGQFIYEWLATFGGETSLIRKQINVVFI